jgi:hypothetical protein
MAPTPEMMERTIKILANRGMTIKELFDEVSQCTCGVDEDLLECLRTLLSPHGQKVDTFNKSTYLGEVVIELPTGEEALEIHRLPNGGIIGIDASFLDQVAEEICDPYARGSKVAISEPEGQGEIIKVYNPLQ